MTDITKEDAKRLAAKVWAVFADGPLDDSQVRNAMVVLNQVFCALLSRWPGPYQEKITDRLIGHCRYLAALSIGDKDAKPPFPTERLPSPREAYIRLTAAGWRPTPKGWVRLKPEMPGDREFALGEDGERLGERLD